MSANLIEAAKTLSLPERIELLDALWESIVAEGYEPPLTNAQADEVDRRFEAHRRNPDDVIDWESMQAEFNPKHGRR